MDFRLPNLGEGIDTATVTAVLVKPGDAVAAGQNVVAVETDKASMEVPSDVAGTVEAVLVKPGDKVPAGGPVLRLKAAEAKTEARKSEPPKQPTPETPASGGREPAVAAESKPAPQTKQPADAGRSPQPSGGKAEFRLPNLGEGIESATVTSVLVKPGDMVAAGQNVVAVETDKASMEVPTDAAGTVEQVHVKPGDKLPPGGLVLTLKASGGRLAPVAAESQAAAPANQGANAPRSPEPAGERTVAARPAKQPEPTGNGVATKDGQLVPAGPATRRMARELGVALGEVKGSGRGGRVTLDDIKGFIRDERQRVKTGAAPGAGGFGHPPLPDFAKFGQIERKAVSQLRQTIARNLTVAWRTMPMVTQHDQADITDLEAGRKRIGETAPKGSPKVTMTVLAVRACVAALREFPHFNSSYDMNAGELVLKKYFHIGIAVDTERGLVVPVIRDADRKSIRDLAAEMTALAEKARAGKLALDEMRGGTFTITNLGGIGGTSFTPIVNYPEVAILGLSRSSLQPVVKEGQTVPRLMLPLSLTYDHRVIDGADGARFTARLAQLFSDPLRLLMET